MLQYKENKILVRSYDSFVEESTTPSSSQPDNSACKYWPIESICIVASTQWPKLIW